MTVRRSNLRAVADATHTSQMVYLVDASGGVHTLDITGYTALTAKQLKGARVFLDPAKAERCGERRRATRN